MKLLGKMLIPALLVGSTAQAEPVDKNESGAFVGAGLQFGQAFKAGGGGSPGAALGLGLEAGYVAKRDTWNRMEIGAEFGTGKYQFNPDQGPKVTIDSFPQFLLKFGYGYSLGDHVFGVFRAGAGLGMGTFEQGSFSSDATAVIGMLGWDVVFPATDSFDLIFGANIKSHNFNVESIGNVEVDSFQLTTTNVYAQARVKL